MVALVTGATGLVGSHIVEELTRRDASGEVRVLARPGAKVGFLREQGVRIFPGSLEDEASLAAAVRGADLIVHSAAALRENDPERAWRVNVDGTRALIEAAAATRVRRFVHVSTVGVYGLLTSTPATEEHPKRPFGSYDSSKLAAEHVVEECSRAHGLDSVVLRPPVVMGERDRHITPMLIELARRRAIPLIGGGRARFSFVDAGDLAGAAWLAATHPAAPGNTYNVESFSASLREVAAWFVARLGTGARLLHVPFALAYAAALGYEGIYRLRHGARTPQRPARTVKRFASDLTFDTSKICHDLGYRPAATLDATFRRAIDWQLRAEAEAGTAAPEALQ